MTGSPPIPVQNQTPRNKPEGWFYNGQILRSDTRFAFQNQAGVVTDTGSQSDLVEFGPGNFQWTTDRLIVAAFLDLMIETLLAGKFADAIVYLVRYDAAHFVMPSANSLGTPSEGGAAGALLGAAVAVMHPGTTATVARATKTVGVNFYPAPFYVPAQSPIKMMHYLSMGADGNNSLYVRATIFSVPAG